MNLVDIKSYGYQEYIAQNKKRNAWLNYHIPKTAGSSLVGEMNRASARSPDKLVVHNLEVGKSLSEGQAWSDYYQNRIKDIEITDQYKTLVTGHFTWNDLQKLDKQQFGKMVFLRNPIDRFISDYRYSTSEAHPENAAFLSAYPTIESYLQNDGQINKLYYYLREAENESVESVIARMESSFAIVGLTEMFNFSISLVYKFMGLERQNPERLNVTKNTKTSVEDIEKLRREIANRHKKDMEIFNHFKQLLLDMKSEVSSA